VAITVALIGAFGAIAAAVIPALTGGHATTPPSPTTSATSVTTSTATDTASGPASSPSPSMIASSRDSLGKLYTEETYNHLGTDVFKDPMGDAVTSGPVSIPFGTYVRVKCWAPNESGMSSINAFYLVETRPWVGEYAPANTFLNADTSGSLDPHVPECAGT
jgi:hypothetical protein